MTKLQVCIGADAIYSPVDLLRSLKYYIGIICTVRIRYAYIAIKINSHKCWSVTARRRIVEFIFYRHAECRVSTWV